MWERGAILGNAGAAAVESTLVFGKTPPFAGRRWNGSLWPVRLGRRSLQASCSYSPVTLGVRELL